MELSELIVGKRYLYTEYDVEVEILFVGSKSVLVKQVTGEYPDLDQEYLLNPSLISEIPEKTITLTLTHREADILAAVLGQSRGGDHELYELFNRLYEDPEYKRNFIQLTYQTGYKGDWKKFENIMWAIEGNEGIV